MPEVPYNCPIKDLCQRINYASTHLPNEEVQRASLVDEIGQARAGDQRKLILGCWSRQSSPRMPSCIYIKHGRSVADGITDQSSLS